jgi:hypothetical protein
MQESRTSQEATSKGAEVHAHGAIPGIWPAASVAVLSAALCWVWLLSGVSATPASDNGSGLATSELAAVGDRDITDALKTMGGTPASLARFKRRADGCPLPLAWVTVTPEANQPTEMIRLRSGSYYSPDFSLSGVPVRIAIPFPAAYDAGHGTLTVLHSGGNVTLGLNPAWHLTAQETSGSRLVTWQPGQNCKQSNG